MRKFVVSALCLALLLAVLAGCGVSQKPERNGYGGAADGTGISGNWKFDQGTVSSTDTNAERAVLYRKESMENYLFTMRVRLDGKGEGIASGFGGYAYYKDAENYAEFSFSAEENILTVSTQKGYDTQQFAALLAPGLNKTVSFDFVAAKVADEFRFYVENKQVAAMTESFEGAGQAALITQYASATFAGVQVEELVSFPEKPIFSEVFTPAAGMPGTWSIEGGSVERTDTDPASAKFESVVFNSATATDYRFKATAKKTADIEGGYGFYGVVGYYQNASNYATVFFKDQFVDVCVNYAGTMYWTGGLDIPNAPEDGAHLVEFVKRGDTLRVYVNGTFLRELRYSMFNRPGSVGFDTNGTCARFEAVSLEPVATLEDERYDALQLDYVNYAHLLKLNEGIFTTVDAAAQPGANYGGLVIAQMATGGSDYSYSMKLGTAGLEANQANYTGIIGGVWGDNYVSMLVSGNGYADLFGLFASKDGSAAAGSFAGLGKKLPDAAFENGVLKAELNVRAEKSGTVIRFYVENEEMYAVDVAVLKHARPGFLANFVGATFTPII